jgi:hypothetical protein
MKGLLRRTFFVNALYFILLHKYITMLNAYFALILHNISYQSKNNVTLWNTLLQQLIIFVMS